MLPEPRPELSQVSDVAHGAFDFAELERLGLTAEDVLDFSVNGNPYGPSPQVQEAMARVPLERYPDREALALRRLLGHQYNVPLEHILVGNGSAEVLWLVALAFLRPGDAVLIVGPTFGEYARAATLMGAQVHYWTALPEDNFTVRPEAVLRSLQQWHPRLVFVCNPNNPTGTYLAPDAIAGWARACPQTLFVVDEAYLPFAADAASVLATAAANLLVLRSMTKAHALAGVRLGYAVGHPEVIGVLTKVRPPWNVNALAQAAGIAALHDQAHLTRTLAQVAQAKGALVRGLHALDLTPVHSTTHFFLIKVGNATALRQALLRHGVQVRDCASFGLPEYIRVATRRPEENARLLAALARAKEEGKHSPKTCTT
jgi:L-threonine-O-3-phosphate decarboxylase